MIISRISNAQEADTDDLGKAIEVVMEKAEDIDPVLTVKMHGDNVIVFAEAKEGEIQNYLLANHPEMADLTE